MQKPKLFFLVPAGAIYIYAGFCDAVSVSNGSGATTLHSGWKALGLAYLGIPFFFFLGIFSIILVVAVVSVNLCFFLSFIPSEQGNISEDLRPKIKLIYGVLLIVIPVATKLSVDSTSLNSSSGIGVTDVFQGFGLWYLSQILCFLSMIFFQEPTPLNKT